MKVAAHLEPARLSDPAGLHRLEAGRSDQLLDSPPPAALTASATAPAPGTARPGTIMHSGAPGSLALAPRLATGYKIAMGIGMGYMLIMML